jgi:hypothetical protein
MPHLLPFLHQFLLLFLLLFQFTQLLFKQLTTLEPLHSMHQLTKDI